MRKILALKNLLSLVLLLIAALYFFLLPRSIQGGDTAELVTAARGLFVAHPPGYPLWIFLQSAWLYLISPTNTFFCASTLSALYAVGTLALLGWTLKEKPLLAFLLVLQLAFTTAFMESALLPDVFSFHALLVAGICALTLSNQPQKFFFAPFLTALGLAHHHTIIFLAPLMFGLFYEAMESKNNLKKFFSGLGTGLFLTTLFYLSLFNFNTHSYFSWGRIETFKDLLNHFLRSDYGTLAFAPSSKEAGGQLEALLFFFKTTGLEWAMISLLALLFVKKKIYNAKTVSLLLSLAASIVFFLMVNFQMNGMGKEIITRFHVMPSVLLAFTITQFFKEAELNKSLEKIAAVAALLIVLFLGFKNTDRLFSLRKDEIIAHYAEDVLRVAEKTGAKLILADNDNSYFALKYMQYEKQNTDSAVVSTSLLFHPWMAQKIEETIPGFILKNKEVIWRDKKLNLEADLIGPNVKKGILWTNNNSPTGQFIVTQMMLGKYLGETSPSAEIKEHILRLEKPALFEGVQGHSKKVLFSQYAWIYLANGMDFYHKGEKEKAVSLWQMALKLVPWCAPALINICEVDKTKADCSPTHIEEIKQSAVDYF